jgi:hypothetical protein
VGVFGFVGLLVAGVWGVWVFGWGGGRVRAAESLHVGSVDRGWLSLIAVTWWEGCVWVCGRLVCAACTRNTGVSGALVPCLEVWRVFFQVHACDVANRGA